MLLCRACTRDGGGEQEVSRRNHYSFGSLAGVRNSVTSNIHI